MDILNAFPSTIASTDSVTYACLLTNNWSGANHPFDYARISDSAHWSKPVLASHNSKYEMWAPDMLASRGVESVAESGSTGNLEIELEAAMDLKYVANFTVGIDQFTPVQVFEEEIFMSEKFPYLSTISMQAPSPDWFTGLNKFSPITEDQFWYDSFEIATFPFDAGTEMGDTYSISNLPEDSPMPIFQLTVDTIPDNGILLAPSGIEVLPVAVWNCVLKTSTSNPDSMLPSSGTDSMLPSLSDPIMLPSLPSPIITPASPILQSPTPAPIMTITESTSTSTNPLDGSEDEEMIFFTEKKAKKSKAGRALRGY
jgi:hypothetical protein